jgi:hypothetical protein
MPDPEWTVELPEAWQTAPFRPGFARVVGEIKLPRKRTALGVMALLKDGTNVVALTWPGGLRVARCSPATGWAIEERFTGRPPGPGEGGLIKLWQICVEALVYANVRVRELLKIAYQTYAERLPEGEEPVTREVFEVVVEMHVSEEILSQADDG